MKSDSMFFRSPSRYPVLVHAQVDEWFKVFVGLALRMEDACNLGRAYRGRISVVRVSKSFGQDESLQITHGLDHFNHRISASYWIYPDEYGLMLRDVDEKRRAELLTCLLSMGIDPSEQTKEAESDA